MLRFRWIGWNLEHIAQHGVTRAEAEWVACHPTRGYPRKCPGGYIVWGRTQAGRWLQVAFARDRSRSGSHVFVYHARPLTPAEKGRVVR
jgi:hypothetical protein